jgi:hypothetical protein
MKETKIQKIMKNSDKRTEIKEVLFRNDKTVTWLKDKMKTKIDLHYLLSSRSVNFDVDIYDEIKEVFKNEGFITSENERSDKFAEQLIQVNGIISHSTYLLNSNASDFLKDNVLDFREKKKLIDIIHKMRSEFNNELDSIQKVIEG